MTKPKRAQVVLVAGAAGMVGSAIVANLKQKGYSRIITATRRDVDFTRQDDVLNFVRQHQVEQVYIAAAKVGGIYANNTYPAEFIFNNLMIEANLIHAAHLCDVQRLLFLGSSCIYPKLAAQPMQESALLTGALEPTNEPYAIAKIAGIKLCESYNRQYGRDYRSVMPTNLYGPGDNFHPQNSHVIPALIQRFHQAKIERQDTVQIWGSGKAKREFLHVNDMAEACVYVMTLDKAVYDASVEPQLSHINVGCGNDCSIAELAELIKRVVGFQGDIEWDHSKPDGAPRKLLDITKLKSLGWQPQISLDCGLRETYQWYLNYFSQNND